MKYALFQCISLSIAILASGCALEEKYYHNMRYTENLQGHLDADMEYCHAIALGATPPVRYQSPPGPRTSYGYTTITDGYGNMYNGTYRQTTYPDIADQVGVSINNAMQSSYASNVYAAVKKRCLFELGWYEISKEEFMNAENSPPETPQKKENIPLAEDKDAPFEEPLSRQNTIDLEEFFALDREKKLKILSDMIAWTESKPYKEARLMVYALHKGTLKDFSVLFARYKKEKRIKKFH